MQKADIFKEIRKIKKWRHQIELPQGIVTPGFINTKLEWARLQVPIDLKGKRILDIGCSDGYYSFRSEQQNADEVIAIDDLSSLLAGGKNGLMTAKQILGSNIEFKQMSIYDLTPEITGHFDLVFFLNVIYHLKHPALGLECIRSVMKKGGILYYKSLFIEKGFVIGGKKFFWNTKKPKAYFYSSNERGGDPTNWWGPNLACHQAMLHSCGFEIEQELFCTKNRIYYKCKAI